LATALAQVEEINRKKTEFLSAVSHELRTPLTSIKGYASILMAGKIGNIPDAVKERLSRINIHSDNLVSLINNLLDITRIESGRVEMHFGLHNTKSVIDNIADLLTPQITAKEIKLSVNVSEAIPEVYIDPSQAERVFINLLSNATKFTPKGGTISINASALEEGGAKFEVIDSGIGMSQDDLGKLFTEFFRVENEINQTVKGTGLGLVLARDIVLAHNGKIWVTSQIGKGTNFSFTLPTSKEVFEKNKRVTTIT
jgi:signal transduction histidine kinase